MWLRDTATTNAGFIRLVSSSKMPRILFFFFFEKKEMYSRALAWVDRTTLLKIVRGDKILERAQRAIVNNAKNQASVHLQETILIPSDTK